MADVRIQVFTHKAGDLPRDHIVNTVYFRVIQVDPTVETDYLALAVATRDAFRNRAQHPSDYLVGAKAYNMDDAKPRPVKALAPSVAVAFPSGLTGPLEVALCLSYYSGSNVKRKRGRIYVGPQQQAQMSPTPGIGPQNANMALATALGNVGGPNVDWCLYSPTNEALPGGPGPLSKITNVWCDNEWDTVRSRGRRATSRLTATTQE
jgi:hypothetical protein